MNPATIPIIFTTYLAVMSLIGFSCMGADKKRARKNQYRISENTLWAITILGGAVGTYAGMKKFRHKTKHNSFKFGLPFFAITYGIVLLMLWI
ncbi:DUF1294 domain-containing protein [Jeotgalibacillus sp. ET6]|uniref:DUF1294 domain-containing protein n=1 Tax=Jeotgalibacillus sp. ET6 TaxID=3037260 RepID=UPI002418969B|nr:DUF1294 domain-containing protein [Jeotgalibacillus sp. ET6]MDG5471023.1 DUF1294 domain-containing protein [Jeotgalibacillus sp. ET6]